MLELKSCTKIRVLNSIITSEATVFATISRFRRAYRRESEKSEHTRTMSPLSQHNHGLIQIQIQLVAPEFTIFVETCMQPVLPVGVQLLEARRLPVLFLKLLICVPLYIRTLSSKISEYAEGEGLLSCLEFPSNAISLAVQFGVDYYHRDKTLD